MKVLFCTIIGILFCHGLVQCQLQGRVVVCEFEVPLNINLDQLGEKKKFPIDPCKLAELDKYDHMLLLPYDKTTPQKPLIKIMDFVNSKKKSVRNWAPSWHGSNTTKPNTGPAPTA